MDERQFARSVSKVLPDLHKHAARLTGSVSDADDLLQDSMLRAWRFRARFSDGTNLRAWMRRILFNTFVSEQRRLTRERRHETEARQQTRAMHVEMPLPERAAQGALQHLSEPFASALGALAEGQRQVLLMVDVEQKSYEQTAKELGIPIGTVMSRLSRARATLRKQLPPH